MEEAGNRGEPQVAQQTPVETQTTEQLLSQLTHSIITMRDAMVTASETIKRLEAERDADKAASQTYLRWFREEQSKHADCLALAGAMANDLEVARASESRATAALRKLHLAASHLAEECNEDDWTVDQQAMLDLHEVLDGIDLDEPVKSEGER
jgi:hypothetical protein